MHMRALPITPDILHGKLLATGLLSSDPTGGPANSLARPEIVKVALFVFGDYRAMW
jgi:hypothetical protein